MNEQPKIIPLIFASGLGTRLRPLTNKIPKPLLPLVGDKTFIDFILEELLANGFTEAYLNYSYGRELFTKKIQQYSNRLPVTLIDDRDICGQGAILLRERPRWSEYDYVLGINGDTILTGALDLFIREPDTCARILSNPSFPVPQNLLADEQGILFGINPVPTEENPYWYGQPLTNIQRHNFLGYLLIPTAALEQIVYEDGFMGLFHPGELIEQLIKAHVTVKITHAPITRFATANTLAELDAIKAQLAST